MKVNKEVKKMKQTITYETAVKIIAYTLNNTGMDLFKASTLLCNLFFTDDKEKTLQDLQNIREKMYKVKK